MKYSTRKATTLKDVAKAANVSAMTVSNVVNRRFEFVSSKTRLKIEQEIIRLNYRKQTAAHNLRVSRQQSVGMIVIDKSPMFLTDYFTTQVVAGLANALNSLDLTMTIQGMNVSQVKDSMIMRSFEVGSICAMLSGTRFERKKTLKQLFSINQPVIIFQEKINDKYEDYCVIRQDDFYGGQLVGKHLLEKNARNLLIIKPINDWPAIENRISGLKECILKNAAKTKISIIDAASESFKDVQSALRSYLDKNAYPDAIFGCNDQIAYASIMLLKNNGVKVPQDIKIIGFNGFDAHRHLQPTLTTIVSPAYELGQVAGKSILDRYRCGSFTKSEIVLTVELSEGEST